MALDWKRKGKSEKYYQKEIKQKHLLSSILAPEKKPYNQLHITATNQNNTRIFFIYNWRCSLPHQKSSIITNATKRKLFFTAIQDKEAYWRDDKNTLFLYTIFTQNFSNQDFRFILVCLQNIRTFKHSKIIWTFEKLLQCPKAREIC